MSNRHTVEQPDELLKIWAARAKSRPLWEKTDDAAEFSPDDQWARADGELDCKIQKNRKI